MLKKSLCMVMMGFLVTFSLLSQEFISAQFEVDFEQKMVSGIEHKEKVTQGHLIYRYPGQVRMEIVAPEAQKMLFVCNQESSWYYTPPFMKGEKGEVVVENASKKLIASLFDILKQGLKSNESYKVTPHKGMTEITFLNKTQKELGIDRVDLYFSEKQSDHLSKVSSFEIFYSGNEKKNVTFFFKNFKALTSIDDKLFVFVPDAKTMNITKK